MSESIPYNKIRAVEKGRGIANPSMLSLKTALDHLNVKYNALDMTTVSLKDMDTFLKELNERCGNSTVSSN